MKHIVCIRRNKAKLIIYQLAVTLGLLTISGSSDFVQNPLVYTKLRFERDYLQVYRPYQNRHTHIERKNARTIQFVEPIDCNTSRKVEYTYYENKEVDNSTITHDDLILNALDRTHKSRLLPAYLYSYDYSGDREKSSDKRLISLDRCKRDLSYLLEKLPSDDRIDPISPELDAFYGSFASEEPGLLFGNYHWTGMWRQCYKRQIFDLDRSNMSNSIAFKGRYCTANIRSSSWNEKIKKMTDELVREGKYFRYPYQQYDYGRFFRIQVGFCMPESCDSSTIDWARKEIQKLALHRLREPYKSYDLVDVFCLPDEGSDLRKLEISAKLLILVAVVWFSSILMATYIDSISLEKNKQTENIKDNTWKPDKTTLDKFVSAMSIRQNWDRLTETKSIQPPAREPDVTAKYSNKLTPGDMLWLNGVKVIGNIIILYAHTGMMGQHLDRFPNDYDTLGYQFLFHFHISSTFTVDWFFAMAGFLVTYVLFVTKKVERNTTGQWLYTVFHRYWRLAPLYLILFWFCRVLFQHTGSGPVWDYGTTNTTVRSVCRRESWIIPLTLTSNTRPIGGECIMPTWYISSDMQFYIVTLILIVILNKSPRLGWLSAISIILSSLLLRFYTLATDPRADHLEMLRPRYDTYVRYSWYMHPAYLLPHYRIGAYLVGLLAGHYVYMVRSCQWSSLLYPTFSSVLDNDPSSLREKADSRRKSANESDQQLKQLSDRLIKAQVIRTVLFSIGSVIVITMALGTWVMNSLPFAFEAIPKAPVVVAYGLSHTSTAIAMSMLLITLSLGHLKGVKQFLAHPAWSVVTRLNFIVFLIQIEVIYWLDQSSERIVDLSARESLKSFLTLTFLCYLLSFIFTITLELPLATLEREFIGVRMSNSNKQNSSSKKVNGQTVESKSEVSKQLSRKDELQQLVNRSGSGQIVTKREK